MKPLGIRDIIGPIMVGPSSSHTAGALRIAAMARKLCSGRPAKVEFQLYGSFAHTYRGHGTDRALCAGILGMEAGDLRIRDSLELAKEAGIDVTFTPLPEGDYQHANTVDILITDDHCSTMCVRGESTGGGAAVLRSIDGIDLYITGETTSLVIKNRDTKGVLAHVASCISEYGMNIATARMYRERKGERAYTIMETDGPIPEELKQAIARNEAISDVRVLPADTVSGAGIPDGTAAIEPDEQDIRRFEALDFADGSALLAHCERQGVSLSEAFLEREDALAAAQGHRQTALPYLTEVLGVMRESAESPMMQVTPSIGGLIGGEAIALSKLREEGGGVCGPQLAYMTAASMAVIETNASMGRVVAAPTAGSAGVIPGVLLALQKSHGYTDGQLIRALAASAAIGYFIMRNATVSGAEGGCQAEIGSASAMAAAAAVELAGGTPAQGLTAAGNALMNMMGLVCDPVAGLVEVPCQKRNASGAATALVSAEMALAGIANLVDFDQTVEAMHKVGLSLPFELRESALGGIAATPSACAFCAGC